MNEENDLIGHDTEIESRIFQRYVQSKEKMKLCEVCVKKVPEIKNFNDGCPVSFFVVGADMQKMKDRVMFVGKTVTCNWGKEANPPDPLDEKSGFIDARYNSKRLLLGENISFFECVAAVCKSLWKEDNLDLAGLWRRIMVSDMVKCSISETFDMTKPIMKKNCVRSGFLRAEFEEVKPTHLIFFTGPDYDTQIEALLDLKEKIVDDPESDFKRWWTKKLDIAGREMDVLRTYHPYYVYTFLTREVAFCNKIANWIMKP